jgi:hypothetical protein
METHYARNMIPISLFEALRWTLHRVCMHILLFLSHLPSFRIVTHCLVLPFQTAKIRRSNKHMHA